MAGKDLQNARKNTNDEFYTRFEDIQTELSHYRKHFKGKCVLCNCDDPYESNFFKYFALNFNAFGLRKLIATCYSGSSVAQTQLSLTFYNPDGSQETDTASVSKPPYKIVITEVTDLNGDGATDLDDVVAQLQANANNQVTTLEGNGDFRSAECEALLDEADIVVTNPPFSLFREYLASLVKHDKGFIIIGNSNALTYKDVFRLFQEDRIRTGYTNFNTGMFFFVPDYFEKYHKEEQGRKMVRVSTCGWYTNLPVKRHQDLLIMTRKYTPEDYPKYADHDAINVNNYKDIPYDYDGVMGVPITFLDKFNPQQFEILECCEPCIELDVLRNMPGFKPFVSRQIKHKDKLCQKTYHRILIRKKQ